ncbi:DUF2182 domain-containing protein [Methyloligella solikamskensis]|uniref:DUF2182 domain-containing protein n=1 Tax=Methyloligella solikamskensis TaxID=1177756 RepID=A0ABW3J660_9HYPH
MIVTLALLAWLAALLTMSTMDEGPGTPLHSLPIFLIGWVVMLTAMMLPSELNYVGTFVKLVSGQKQAGSTVTLFIAGYALAWVCYGLAAFALDAVLRLASFETLSWARSGPLWAGMVLVLAALYQLSSLKERCLDHCRAPISYFARHWRPGRLGALVMGARHGAVCVGCCWALMAVMFAVGVMNLTWMALLTLIMFAEKIVPGGKTLGVPIALLLLTMGVWVALSPDTAPMLADPLVFRSLCGSL